MALFNKAAAERCERVADEIQDATVVYKVHVGGRHYRRFKTLDAAAAYCGKVFDRSGIVLSITATA